MTLWLPGLQVIVKPLSFACQSLTVRLSSRILYLDVINQRRWEYAGGAYQSTRSVSDSQIARCILLQSKESEAMKD